MEVTQAKTVRYVCKKKATRNVIKFTIKVKFLLFDKHGNYLIMEYNLK